MRKPAFSICENKDAGQLRGNREADQRLCFPYIDNTIPLLSLYEMSSLQPSSVIIQPGLCRTWSETPKTDFLRTRLIYCIGMSTLWTDYTSMISDFAGRTCHLGALSCSGSRNKVHTK